MADLGYHTPSGRRPTRRHTSYARPNVDSDDLDDFEEESGRASRARTRLIVEGFSNLALIATFFAGVQAELLSDSNDDNEGALSIATSAAFFGGLIFSVFTAILATLSGRWFSILREDDADYLSSRWLAQDSRLNIEDAEKGNQRLGPDLKEYLDFQIKSLQGARLKKTGVKSRAGTLGSSQTNANRDSKNEGTPMLDAAPLSRVDSPEPVAAGVDERPSAQTNASFDPLVFDIDCILNLLHKERTGQPANFSNRQMELRHENQQMCHTTWKERALGWALLSPIVTETRLYALNDNMPIPEARRATIEIIDAPARARTSPTRMHTEPIGMHEPASTLIQRIKSANRRSTIMSMSPSMRLVNGDIGDGISGRATRQRTQLIVEGFSNLALVAVLFSGVQAQLIQIIAEDVATQNTLDIATNAVFFGGLVLSVFSAMLACLSGRWFSILREDDSEYLSSCWLAAECNEDHPKLPDYVRFQLRLWGKKLSEDADLSEEKDSVTASIEEPENLANPKDEDIKRILKLLERDNKDNNGETTMREKFMSQILLSAIWICSAAFVLFCAGIVMLVWNKQHITVAICTSALVFVCISFIPMFFLKHRRKHVISHLNLKRPAL
ncbi:hypothetical protein BN14_01432 [Rhizoctonia solani AG-1 IB]|uniref:Transmembrane protein n=1 Tax=Thanatephorus cucumeris (strain AG1-IB / isolate 7/3/14) TaxID=1108050 RepID=M5BKV2_THACB|nr:hypothetical protein BN14_01432 [Rhizoctonia solani AG-1 IB]